MSNNDPNCIPVKSKGGYSFQFHSKRLSRSPSINERDKLQVIHASAVITLSKRVQLPRSQTSSARQLKMAPEGPPCLAIQQTMSPDLLSTPPLKNNLKYWIKRYQWTATLAKKATVPKLRKIGNPGRLAKHGGEFLPWAFISITCQDLRAGYKATNLPRWRIWQEPPRYTHTCKSGTPKELHPWYKGQLKITLPFPQANQWKDIVFPQNAALSRGGKKISSKNS